MSILIIGGKGYIGSRLYEYLDSKDYNVYSVDTCWFGNYTSNDNLCVDYNSLSREWLSKWDTIILLAGHASVQMCEMDYYSSFNNNCRNFIELIKKINPNTKFIYASSSHVCGGMDKNFVADETRFVYGGNNNYDISKFMLDAYMLNGRNGREPILAHWYGLRFGTVNGFSPNSRIDLMINSMVESAKQNGHINVHNGHIDRAILGLNDLCRAIETILVKGTPDKSGVYNLSSFNASVDDIANDVSRLIGTKIINHGISGTPLNFRISNKKFENTFDFKFIETVESIVESLLLNDTSKSKTKRDKEYYYE
jgi:nucleoside-diphosphate-sugar epimerase